MTRFLARVAALFLIVLFAAGAWSQTYPTKPIRLIVPFPPGNFSDGGARLAAQRLSEQMKQPVVVENRPGAGGTVGTESAARAAPDGYTLLLGTASTLAVAPHVFRERKYDSERAFTPISMILRMPLTFVVRAGLPTTVAEFAAYAKSRPGKLNFGSAGRGTQVHLAAELFRQLAGIDATHVPYQGGAPAMAALLAGTIDYEFDLPATSTANHKAGKLRILAVTSARRLASIPDVPTTAEAGMPRLDLTAWMGLLAPAGVPAEVVTRIDAEMRVALASKEMVTALDGMGAVPAPVGPREFAELIARENATYANIVKSAGIVPE